jgi:DNA-binding transcriptional regulator LsrR (DeoR family)
MKQNKFGAKIHELEEALNERRDEIARTKTSESEIQEMSDIQKRVEALIEGVGKLESDEEKREVIRQADELLLELHRS